jgi:hypothetical protein
MHIYNISTDINGNNGHYSDEWDEWMNRAYISRFDEDHFESRLNKLKAIAFDSDEDNEI